MKFKSGRAVHIYYSVMSLACAILLGTGIAYFWKTGAVNPHRLSLVYEASHHLDEVKKRDDIVRVKKLTDLDRVRDAVKIMDRISVDIKKLNSVHSVDLYEELGESLGETRKSLNGLLALSRQVTWSLSSVTKFPILKISLFQEIGVRSPVFPVVSRAK